MVASLVHSSGSRARGLQELLHSGSVVPGPRLWRVGSVVMVHGPSFPAARGIVLDQGLNLCPLHRQADSQSLDHQGSPKFGVFNGLPLLVKMESCL